MTGYLLKINGTAVPNLTKYVVSYNKLWKDAERNMNGTHNIETFANFYLMVYFVQRLNL